MAESDFGPEADRLAGTPHPRHTRTLHGHATAERTVLEAFASGRMPHAWLIAGPEGIGKATFAYRFARRLLGWRPGLPAPATLDVPAGDRTAAQVDALAHPDLKLLRRRPSNDGKRMLSDIPVDDIRDTIEMFHATAGTGGWRVCIIDSAEDLNTSGANALLKLIEEPPERAAFLIVAHQPGRVLPTIRSRSRLIRLEPLEPADLHAVLDELGQPAGPERERAVALADGSLRRAFARLDAGTLALIERTTAALDSLPDLAPGTALALGEAVAGRAADADFAIFLETVEDWVRARVLGRAGEGAARLAPLVEAWDKTAKAAHEIETFNLDRRPLVLALFQDMSEALRRVPRA